MRMIGRYQVLGLLGKGGMGAVYKAQLPGLGKIVALKRLAPVDHMVDLMGWETIRSQFLAEARLMAGLRHPHLSEVWDLDEDADGMPFFTMEYACHNLGAIIGESYRVEAQSRPLQPEKAFRYARQTLEGLARLHAAGVVHRDIKPFNLLLSDEDTVKIIDFGLSRLRGEAPAQRPGGMKIGSPFYAAPEQERDPENVGPGADCYAVGVTLYRMLAGRLPHAEIGVCGFGLPPGAEPDALDEDGLSREAPLQLDALSEELFTTCETFFRTALARQPEARYTTAEAMAEAMDDLEARWRAEVEAICQAPLELFEEDRNETATETSARISGEEDAPRAIPIKTGPRLAMEALRLDDLGRPLAPPNPRFIVNNGDDTVVRDPSAGLLWRRGGSRYPMTWRDTHAHIARLNAAAFAGRTGWRLPTVEELCRLLDQGGKARDYCMDPVFETAQLYLWSADRRTFTQAWMVNATMGYVDAADMTCRLWTRAVCDLEQG